MNRSRLFILLGIVLLVAAGLLVITNQTQPPPAPQVVPTPVEEPSTLIMVAAQDIPRGTAIVSGTVIPFKWPNASLVEIRDQIITDPAEIIGKIARQDIPRLQPILKNIVTSDRSQLINTGCDAALGIPTGKVAVAFPINQVSSAGYSIGTGDRVDVLVAFSVLDVNKDGQYPTIPFNRDLQSELTAAGMTAPEADAAALTHNNAAIAQALQQTTGAEYLPRLVTQLTLQNIGVLNVGDWPAPCLLGQKPAANLPSDQAPQPTPAPVVGTPTPTPPRPTILILVVDRQQALILQWLRNAEVSVELALRSPTDFIPSYPTDAVHYQYILTTYAIGNPPKTDTIIQHPAPVPGQ